MPVKLETVRIAVLNWEKHQGKAKSYEKTNWFRMDNRFIEHALWDDLTAGELKFFIYLLCLVSRNGHRNGTVVANLRALSAGTMLRACSIRAALRRLATHGVIEYQVLSLPSRTARGPLRNVTERNDTEGENFFSSQEKTKRILPPDILRDVRILQGRPLPENEETND